MNATQDLDLEFVAKHTTTLSFVEGGFRYCLVYRKSPRVGWHVHRAVPGELVRTCRIKRENPITKKPVEDDAILGTLQEAIAYCHSGAAFTV